MHINAITKAYYDHLGQPILLRQYNSISVYTNDDKPEYVVNNLLCPAQLHTHGIYVDSTPHRNGDRHSMKN